MQRPLMMTHKAPPGPINSREYPGMQAGRKHIVREVEASGVPTTRRGRDVGQDKDEKSCNSEP